MTHKVRYDADIFPDDDSPMTGFRLEKQYVKYKSRDTKVQKRRNREVDWYD